MANNLYVIDSGGCPSGRKAVRQSETNREADLHDALSRGCAHVMERCSPMVKNASHL